MLSIQCAHTCTDWCFNYDNDHKYNPFDGNMPIIDLHFPFKTWCNLWKIGSGFIESVLVMHSWIIGLLGEKEKWEEKNEWRGVAGGGNGQSKGEENDWEGEVPGLEMEWVSEEKKGAEQ